MLEPGPEKPNWTGTLKLQNRRQESSCPSRWVCSSWSLSMVCTIVCVHTILRDPRGQFKVGSPGAYRKSSSLVRAEDTGIVKLTHLLQQAQLGMACANAASKGGSPAAIAFLRMVSRSISLRRNLWVAIASSISGRASPVPASHANSSA